jgi:hypothetical protein
VLMLFEGNTHMYRQFFVDGSDHPKDLKPTWYGDSRAHWDGDTLVVDTIGLKDNSWIDMPGHPHTKQMHLTERFHRRDYGNPDLSFVTAVQMYGVLIVLVTHVLGHLKGGFESRGSVLNPRFAIRARIVDDDLNLNGIGTIPMFPI